MYNLLKDGQYRYFSLESNKDPCRASRERERER